MALYAIGDIQGCYDPFARLLDKLRFDPLADRLWLVGDLVNRGPQSAKVLRLARELGKPVTAVLGNHDLYLLMVAAGFTRRGKDDTLDNVLKAKDRDELLDWLVRRPLVHREDRYLVVHAGVPPAWSASEAVERGLEVSDVLRGKRSKEFLLKLQGDQPRQWDPRLTGWDRLRFIVNALTRMRFCLPDGELVLRAKGPPAKAPIGTLPWFKVPYRACWDHTVVCGHWSALGLHREDGVIALDTGCVWGGALSAIRLEDGALFQVSG
jgi:bis(5'-nucleosyl)-tetraphosphatase (symmetrical)